MVLTKELSSAIISKFNSAKTSEEKQKIKDAFAKYLADSKAARIKTIRDKATAEETKKKSTASIVANRKTELLRKQQLPQRMTGNLVGPNLPTNRPASNAAEATHKAEYIKQKIPFMGTKSGPNGETVRKNSKGKYYYINKNGNAVIAQP